MLQVEKMWALLGIKKFNVAVVVLVACSLMASFEMISDGVNSAKAQAMLSLEDTFILVHLDEAKNFSEANAFCEEHYTTHLAVVHDSEENERMQAALAHWSTAAWIGFADLYGIDDFQWVDNSLRVYQNWDEGEPSEQCVQMSAAGLWSDVACETTNKAFFCQATARFALIKATPLKSFTEAEAFCEAEYSTQLMTVDSAETNSDMTQAMIDESVLHAWIGYEDTEGSFQWLDGSDSAYVNWFVGEPLTAVGDEDCAYTQTDGKWRALACADSSVDAFFCAQHHASVVHTDDLRVAMVATQLTSGQAKKYCENTGTVLYSIENYEDNDRVANALRSTGLDKAWIGLGPNAPTYEWANGQPLAYNNWAPEYPTYNPFVQMDAADGKWNTACVDATLNGVVCAAPTLAPQ